MKKKMLLLASVAVMAICTANAQQGGGGGQRMTPEERTKMTMDKLADFKLDKDKYALTDSAIINYYRGGQKIREDAMAAGGQPDRDAMREKMQKLGGERDDKLKKIFTDDQFKKWKDEIEPSLRPQRPPQGGNN